MSNTIFKGSQMAMQLSKLVSERLGALRALTESNIKAVAERIAGAKQSSSNLSTSTSQRRAPMFALCDRNSLDKSINIKIPGSKSPDLTSRIGFNRSSFGG